MIDVDQAARDTLDRAVEGLRETGYLEWLTNTYRKATEVADKDLGRPTRAWSDEDRRRILFEAVAYMSAILLERELSSYFTRRTLLGRAPDRRRMEAFRASFLDYLPEKLDATVLERLREYSGGWGGRRALEHFGACMGRAIEPGPEPVARSVALESVPMLAIVVHGALDREFGVPPRPKTARKVLSIALAVAATLALALAGDFSCFVTDSVGDTSPPDGEIFRSAARP
jgi:hypothetical protein